MPNEVSPKQCSKCKEIKPREEFYPDKRKRSGLQSQCRDCMNGFLATYIKTNQGKSLKKIYARSARIKYYKSEKGKAAHRAHSVFAIAVKRGIIIRPGKCSKCEVECKPDAHHHKGYEGKNRLDVIWLCHKCHSQLHLRRSSHDSLVHRKSDTESCS